MVEITIVQIDTMLSADIFIILFFNIASVLCSSILSGSLETEYAALLEELHGAHLRIAATNFSTSMVIRENANGTFSYSGYAVDACEYMAEMFQFNFSFVNTRVEDVKKLGPKETEASFLINNEADIAVTQMALSWSLFLRLDVSIPFYSAGFALLVPWPDEESRLLAPIHPFQTTVWLILLLTLPSMALVMSGLPGIYDNFFGDNNLNQRIVSVSIYGDRFNAIVANITSHAGSWPTRKQLFYRILLGSWCLVALVLVNAYSSLLITYLTVPTLLPAAKNFDEFSFTNVQNLGSITDKNSLSTALLYDNNGTQNAGPDSKSKIFRRAKIFADRYRKHPEWLFTTPKQRFDLLYTGRFAHAVSEQLFYGLLSELNNKAGYCKITASTKRMDDLIDYHYIFAYQKHWRYTDAMRNKMQWWSDTGLALHWIKSYQPPTKGCLLQDYKKNVPSIRVLTLKDLSSAFAVLLMGCVLSFLVFLVEHIRFKMRIIRRG